MKQVTTTGAPNLQGALWDEQDHGETQELKTAVQLCFYVGVHLGAPPAVTENFCGCGFFFVGFFFVYKCVSFDYFSIFDTFDDQRCCCDSFLLFSRIYFSLSAIKQAYAQAHCLTSR